jgi:hypothetical protein
MVSRPIRLLTIGLLAQALAVPAFAVDPTPPEVDVIVLDDFESYTDDPNHRIFQVWCDVYTPEEFFGYPYNYAYPYYYSTGAMVGHVEPPFAEQGIVHAGTQSMPVDYNNVEEPWFSQIYRSWSAPQDWTTYDVNTLSLWFQGEATNSPDRFYVALEDKKPHFWAVNHPDPNALLTIEWRQWRVPLQEFTRATVDLAAIKRLYIGVGDPWDRTPGGAGMIYIDDIMLTKRTRQPGTNGK